MLNSKLIGKLVKERRMAAHLSLDEAAALCNVGRRFYFELERGKESLHFMMTIRTLNRMGVKLSVSEIISRRSEGKIVSFAIPTPAYDDGHFLRNSVVSCELASKFLASPWVCTPASDMLNIQFSTVSKAALLFPGGGVGLAELFSHIDENSAQGIVDASFVIKWVIYALIVGANLTSKHLWIEQGGEKGERIIAFPPIVGSTLSGGTYNGALSLNGETDPRYMRADHFIHLAEVANVRPAFVFEIMRSAAAAVPALLKAEVKTAYAGRTVTGQSVEVIREVESRAARMNEITASAVHQGIAGLVKAPHVVVGKEREDSTKYNGHETLYE